MDKEYLYNLIDNWIKEKGTKSFHWLYRIIENDVNLMSILNENIIEELQNSNMPKKIYHFYNDIKEIPKCRYCGKTLNFITFVRPYIEFCNRECSQLNQTRDKDIIDEKRKKTNKEKYGVEYVMQSEEIKKKYSVNSIEKYGVDWVSKSGFVKEKISNTWQNKENKEEIDKKRYENYKKSIREKYKDDTLTSVLSIDSVQQQRRNTNLKLFGNENTFLVQELIEKSIQTNMERYGYPNAMQNSDIQRRQFISAVAYKEYELPSGKIVKVQGYNNLAIPYLLETYTEEDIQFESECPNVKYIIDDGAHYYRPDFYIKKENKIIEVKSIYYLLTYLDKNLIKIKSCIDQAYEGELWVFITQENLVRINFKEKEKLNEFLLELGAPIFFP